jgi:hypothetical protein
VDMQCIYTTCPMLFARGHFVDDPELCYQHHHNWKRGGRSDVYVPHDLRCFKLQLNALREYIGSAICTAPSSDMAVSRQLATTRCKLPNGGTSLCSSVKLSQNGQRRLL